LKKLNILLISVIFLLAIPAWGDEPEPLNNEPPVPEQTADTVRNVPKVVIKKEAVSEDPAFDARHDASRQVSKLKWTACGCLGLYFGVGASLLFVGSPREDRLMGKSAEYILSYSRTYKSYARQYQFRSALLGCTATTCLAIPFIVLVGASSTDGCGPDITCGLSDDCNSINNCANSTSNCMNSSSNCSSPQCGSGSCASAAERAPADIPAP